MHFNIVHQGVFLNITISGIPGTGTTTVTRLLVDKLGISSVSAGAIFRELAKEHDMTLEEFGNLCEEDEEFDRKLDARQKSMSLKEDNLIFEGRLSGFMCKAGLKVWLHCPVEVRAKRVASREKDDLDVIMHDMLERERSEKTRYMKYYNIDIDDTSEYDIVIDTSKFTPSEIVAIIAEKYLSLI